MKMEAAVASETVASYYIHTASQPGETGLKFVSVVCTISWLHSCTRVMLMARNAVLIRMVDIIY
jgi:hypothetical protein